MSGINPIYNTINIADNSIGKNGLKMPGDGTMNAKGAAVEGDTIAYEKDHSSANLKTLLSDAASYLRYMHDHGATDETINNVLHAVEDIGSSQGVSSADILSGLKAGGFETGSGDQLGTGVSLGEETMSAMAWALQQHHKE